MDPIKFTPMCTHWCKLA